MLFRLIHPLHLLFSALMYALGVSLANYLGKPILPVSFGLGLFIVFLNQSTMNLLAAVFRFDNEPLNDGETRSKRQILRNNVFFASLACLVVIALTAYVLFVNGLLPLSSFFFLLLTLFVTITYSIPPFRFTNRGAGEFLLAIQIAYIVPSFAFTLQAGETHRFLALAIPLSFLAFSYFVVTSFESFAQDQKLGRVTFLTRVGWERTVPIHHACVIFAYMFFLILPVFNIALNLIAPAILIFPFALFQIIQLRGIAVGAKPNWILLHATAVAVFGLTAYFLAITFWTR